MVELDYYICACPGNPTLRDDRGTARFDACGADRWRKIFQSTRAEGDSYLTQEDGGTGM